MCTEAATIECLLARPFLSVGLSAARLVAVLTWNHELIAAHEPSFTITQPLRFFKKKAASDKNTRVLGCFITPLSWIVWGRRLIMAVHPTVRHRAKCCERERSAFCHRSSLSEKMGPYWRCSFSSRWLNSRMRRRSTNSCTSKWMWVGPTGCWSLLWTRVWPGQHFHTQPHYLVCKGWDKHQALSQPPAWISLDLSGLWCWSLFLQLHQFPF